jgi:hypothetical protein
MLPMDGNPNARRSAAARTAAAIADVHILWAIELAECVVGCIDICVEAVDIRHEPAQGSLPSVQMSIDESAPACLKRGRCVTLTNL